ncbi:hypothetical protein GCM10012285_61370 [Streptomyces kronopolitis]|uniref:Uncharacterized protein n=1 Tax=Streptomyces kronopolitis TaxID=1612435 RepID=A0ABQ2K297_9ACTN|nr:hypothetical protein [Streptomyces kronopolitis]GGN61887.1 hypothetical protein GCM10012285_61370 [Streptomyces kronopolitis]
MFACLLIRRPRRLRHLRRLAAATAPATRTLLPGHPAPPRPAVPAQPTQLPPDFKPAEPILPSPAGPDDDERHLQARLQVAIDGRAHSAAQKARHD